MVEIADGKIADIIDSLSPSERQALGYVCALDFRAFISACLIDQFGFPFSPCHDYIADLIQNNIGTKMRHVVAAPRGFGKSSLISEAAPLWLVCRKEYLNLPDKDPRNKHYIIITSDVTDQAIERLSNIKLQLESNDAIRALFPKSSGIGPVWKGDYIITNSQVAIRSLGTGSKIRGRRFGIWRPDLAIQDDIENIEQINSESMRNLLYEWFTRDLMKAIDPERGDALVVGTLISKNSLLYKLLYDAEFSAWKGKIFKAIVKWPKNMELWDTFGEILKDKQDDGSHLEKAKDFYLSNKEAMDDEAEVLWPDRFSLLDLMIEYYTEGKRSFLLERQNEIKEEYEKVFNLEDYYYYTDEEFESINKSNLIYYMYVDPATGKRKGRSRRTSTDMFAVCVLAKDITKNIYYIVDYFADIIPTNKQFKIIKKFLDMYPVLRLYIEANTSQYYYYESLRDWLIKEKVFRPVPKPDINKDSKERRIESLTTYLENWTLRLKYDHKELIRLLADFPSVEYDDLLDCVASCFLKAYKSFKLLCA